MKKIVIATPFVLLVLGVYIFITKSKENTIASPEIQNSNQKKLDTVSPNNTRYIEYSKANFEKANKTRRVLFFYASWCPICRPADMDFQTNSDSIPSDVTVIRINYNDTETDNEEKELAQKYNITYQHTFVQIDEYGNEVAKWNGGQTKELLANLN